MYDFYAICIIYFMVFMQIIGLFCAALMDSKITKQDRVVILVNCFFTSILSSLFNNNAISHLSLLLIFYHEYL